MSNFAKYENLQALFTAIGKKKLSVSDTMPTAGAAYEDICILYIGPTDANYTKGYVYKCEEVTPATDPKTYEWNAKINVDVDLSKYKTIFPGTKEEWETLTEAQQDQYDYCFFDGDESDYYAVIDEVAKGDMHPVTSNAVADTLENFQTALTFDNAPTENSNNPVKSNGLYVANQNIYKVMSEMGAKNLFRVMNVSQVINGIEWVVNDDGTITANGTATGESKFTAQSKSAATHYYDENMMKAIAGKTIRYSGCPSGGSSSTYLFRLYIANAGGSTDEYGEGAERTIVSDFLERNFSVECIIKSGQTVTNLTYKPMICLASDTDTTYQPYSKTNKQITDDTASAVANVPNGAINLAKPISARTTTVNDVEFVIDSEGKVTANGTASANIRFNMAEVTLKAGRTYKLYEPSSLQARRPLNPESCRCYARIESSGVWVLQNNGWRDSYTPSSDVVVSVGIAMQSGNQVTDEVFAPMLVLDGTDVGNTFYPYAMTNRELTANAWIGKPRSAWLNLGNKTTLTITVPITPYGGSYMQGSIKLFGYNNSTLIDCSFAFTLSRDNDSVNASKLSNYGDSAVALGSITTDGTNVTITLNNLTTYVNLMLFYGTSMHNSYVSNTNMPEWTFS